MKLQRATVALAACSALALGVAACGDDDSADTAATGGTETSASVDQNLSGSIRIDGSSTVQPIAEAASELFQSEAPNVKITVGGAGTGDGFERFCRGEIAISDASRAIEKDEIAACQKAGIVPVEVQVGIDGLSVIVNKDLAIPNDCITTKQLDQLLDPKSKVANYKELGAGFPDEKVSFFTPGTESGTYDYFTETVLETDAEQRTKGVQTSADDNQIITGIEGTQGSLGYVGFAFAESQKDKLKILQVDGGKGCVAPTVATIADGTYAPLSRPLFMYPNEKTVAQPEVKGFIQYILDNNQKVNDAGGYVPLTDELLTEAKANLDASKGNVEAPA
ncbi:MAG TPA: phosphate ABC transporter substrate-binding protein PstS family protein [Solirubrobacteraceae bacterium]|nr:phosphate ABC transporter substrate-binding protein PstS family protein [Solirubrobacteraceae bacterium]